MEFFLSSDIHHGDELFSVQSRGKQCAFMSLSAILTAQNIPLIDWSKTTFNNVLLQGDTMHSKALDHGLIVLDPRIEFLSIDNLPTVVSIPCGKNMFSYEICRSVTSPIHANTATSPVMPTNSDLHVVVQSADTLKDIDQLVEVQNIDIDLPIVVEPVEAQNIIDLPIVVEPVEAQNNIELPIWVEPIEAQNIELPIGVEPIEAQNIEIPIVVEPIEAQNIIEQPIIEIHEAYLHWPQKYPQMICLG